MMLRAQKKIATEQLEEVFLLLEKEIQFSDELLEILDQEQEALKKADLQALIALSKKKTSHVARISRIDRALDALLGECLHRRQRDTPRRNQEMRQQKIVELSLLLPWLGVDDRDKLLMFKKQVLTKRQQIGDRNYINKKFVEDSLGFVNDAVSMMNGAIAQGSYGADGASQNGYGQPAFVSKEV